MFNSTLIQPYKGYTGTIRRVDDFYVVSIQNSNPHLESAFDDIEDAQRTFNECVEDYIYIIRSIK